jgi:hypothetical protein
MSDWMLEHKLLLVIATTSRALQVQPYRLFSGRLPLLHTRRGTHLGRRRYVNDVKQQSEYING